MIEECDVIVIGIGGMGSAAMFHLAHRGLRVLGIEQHEVGHSLGSSSSPSRGFRKAAFAHPTYVALANSAETLWRSLEAISGQTLLQFTSALFIAPPDHPAMVGMTDSARRHELPHEILSARQLEERFPVFRPGRDNIGILEHEAGVLFADRCNAAHVHGALAKNAVVRERERVLSIEREAVDVIVGTDRAEYRARRVVITAGPWLPALLGAGMSGLPGLQAPLRVERQVELWFSPDGAEDFDAIRLPLFHFGLPDQQRSYYGVPRLDDGGVKVCRHYGGSTVHADTVDRNVSTADEDDVRGFLREYIPRANGMLRHAKVCMNTNTPDMHFIVGVHPADNRIIVAGGFSGHGFKYASVIGEIVADLVVDTRTRHNTAPFSPHRFTQ